MNVMLIAQCSKRALTETRRVLDQFAERRGERAWQTAITWDGLQTLRKLLKRTARKNTAVACHWIRGQDHSELLWIVGDVRQFNAQGAVPTNMTTKDVLREECENNWHTLERIAVLAGIAGLFHDFGKANKLFQDKLNPKKKHKKVSEPLRHEWVSLRLFLAFVHDLSDKQWLEKLSQVQPDMEGELLECLEKDTRSSIPNPFKSCLAKPIALTVAWLIVSHHKLPLCYGEGHGSIPSMSESEAWLSYYFNAGWNSPQLYDESWSVKEWEHNWSFGGGTPVCSGTWCKKARSVGKRALKLTGWRDYSGLEDVFGSHVARMSLMLADHLYSAAEPVVGWQDKRYKVYANTDRKTRALKQKLDEHTVGVGHYAYLLAKRLPEMLSQLPTLTQLRALKKPTTVERFRWQNKAFELASGLAQISSQYGFFGVNMASTGCGKTFANARIMYGLASEAVGCRFNVALGLRTLTLQTGDALIERLGLAGEDIAVLIGSKAVQTLHEQAKKGVLALTKQGNEQPSLWESLGSESMQPLLDDSQYVRYDGAVDSGFLGEWLQTRPQLHQLISAPVLVSTIDYLMPATEGARGGRQIAPMLRLLSSDLVLDEPDDFGLEDLPALCRLMHWAGLLGSRVLLSSATLPPSLVEAMFTAYSAGRQAFNLNRGDAIGENSVVCAWFDEFSTQSQQVRAGEGVRELHQTFVQKRIQNLAKTLQKHPALRWAELATVETASQRNADVIQAMAEAVQQSMLTLHQRHAQLVPINGVKKRVSFGLVRMANINALVAVAKALLTRAFPETCRVHFCVYHGQYPLMMRSRIENVLDQVLNRSKPEMVWEHPDIISSLHGTVETDHLFVVLGSAVTEVGRDHDYDWSVVEPSSMRSLIQLAGRIQRHRGLAPTAPNLVLLRKNVKALRGDSIAYCRPGFESENFPLIDHDLSRSLEKEQYQYITATPRVQPRPELDPTGNLVDLEHAHLQATLLGGSPKVLHAAYWWQESLTWSGEFQRRTPFRKSAPQQQYVLYQADEYEALKFSVWLEDGSVNSEDHRFLRSSWCWGNQVSPWISHSPEALVQEQAQRLDEDIHVVCLKFMQIHLRDIQSDWCFHPLLGVYEEMS